MLFVFLFAFMSFLSFLCAVLVRPNSSAWTPFLRGSQRTELPIGRQEDDSAMSGPRNTTCSPSISQRDGWMNGRTDR